MYIRKVCYLDYYENGVRVKNAGYVKLQGTDRKLKLELRVKGLAPSESCQAWIEAEGRDEPLALLQIRGGSGAFQGTFDLDGRPEDRPQAAAFSGFRIRLPGGRMLRASYRGSAARAEASRRDEPHPRKSEALPTADGQPAPGSGLFREDGSAAGSGVFQGEGSASGSGTFREEGSAAESGMFREDGSEPGSGTFWEAVMPLPGAAAPARPVSLPEKADGTIEREEAQQRPQAAERETERQRPLRKAELDWTEERYAEAACDPLLEEPLEEPVSADKWEQLCRVYRPVHPFRDQTYLRLSPRDFVILRKEYHPLVHNSFLLHGFYNYRHLILGREQTEEGEAYYLGVPGTYYEREKTVAVMFGFEGFEASGSMESACGEADAEHGIQPGAFGYYMKRVEI